MRTFGKSDVWGRRKSKSASKCALWLKAPGFQFSSPQPSAPFDIDFHLPPQYIDSHLPPHHIDFHLPPLHVDNTFLGVVFMRSKYSRCSLHAGKVMRLLAGFRIQPSGDHAQNW